ncbi:hypothetical protein BCR37DRAFT_396718 [Protomyces lactucae-debilis]|uniref:Dihydrodipicolinate synthase n=1 Tax=Protomyces lactucae-debilis TaxID=2754530 RepID=A0A1Y2FT03_PROLT|nr:uncharacterized protein BCR37DRAFT_396718 [Protomyces lactucae-debilis]ORY87133.1 hypothetical protein BCR37DRAFT_396718 [Protomyces lactucae-debilis]
MSTSELFTLPGGIYGATPTFFHEDESVDIQTCVEHSIHLAKAGVVGLVLQGSTGEAVSLTRDERRQIIAAARQGLDDAHHQEVVIVAGIGAGCTREAINLARDAAESGAICGISLCPSYFIGQISDNVIVDYYTRLADMSPIPILIYNFPAVTNGLNISAVVLAQLAQVPGIVGCKLTCNSIAKMQYLSPSGGNLQRPFQVFPGSTEFLSAACTAGVAGSITGMANLFPYTVVRLWHLLQTGKDKEEAQRLQILVTNYEYHMMKAFLPGVRATLDILGRHGGHSRAPLPDATKEEVEFYASQMTDIAAEEKRLAALG